MATIISNNPPIVSAINQNEAKKQDNQIDQFNIKISESNETDFFNKLSKVLDEHSSIPQKNSQNSFSILEKRLNEISDALKADNATKNIKNEDWDFSYSKGKISVVSSSLSNNEKSTLEDLLNKDNVIKNSVNEINDSIIQYHEYSPKELFYGHGNTTEIYKDVGSQLDKGCLRFKEMISDSLKKGSYSSEEKHLFSIETAKKYLIPSVDIYA